MQVYRIDLRTSNMHWFEFLALFRGLPNTTKLAEIISIRATDLPEANKYNMKQRQNLLKMKDLFKLKTKQSRNIEQKINDLFEGI